MRTDESWISGRCRQGKQSPQDTDGMKHNRLVTPSQYGVYIHATARVAEDEGWMKKSIPSDHTQWSAEVDARLEVGGILVVSHLTGWLGNGTS